jgi:GcrA cell cycle regulator
MSLWTPTDDDLLRKLWADGLSCSQIGMRVRRSRNAVIGRVHRLGLPGRVTTSRITFKRSAIPRKARPFIIDEKRGPSLPAAPLPPPNAADIPRISFEKLDHHHCKWPCAPEWISTRAPYYCGDLRIPGSSYCDHHLRRSRGLPDPRRPAPAAPVPAEAAPVLEAA